MKSGEKRDALKLKSIGWIDWLFGIVVVSYAFALPIGASFGVIDDHLCLTTILSGRNLDFFIRPVEGRFFPLDGQEYNIVSFFSLSPSAFYIYNMLQFAFVIFLISKIIALCIPDVKNKKNLIYGIVLLTIFSPGFVTAWFRLFVSERSVLMFFLVFFLMYLLYQKKQKYSYIICGLVAANIALYYKEPVFLMLGAFGFFHLVFGWKTLDAKQKLFDALIIVSAAIFSLVYFFAIFMKMGPIRYGVTPHNPIIYFLKNVFNYTLTDPFLMILLLGLFVYRLFEVIVRKKKLKLLYDATLFAGVVYILIFLKLNMFSFYYLLPAYAFGTFGLVYFLIIEEYIKRRLFKMLIGIVFTIYMFSALPLALHLISYHKNVPNTFQDTLSFLTKYINREGKRVTIYLDGVDRGIGIEVYESFADYLAYQGFHPEQFDFKSDIPSRNSVIFSKGDSKSPFTVFRDPSTSQAEAGDLLIITPYTSKFVDQKYLDNLKRNYELLYRTKVALAIPDVSLKSLVKYCLIRYHHEQFSDDVMLSNNNFNWPDFYVFRKCDLPP